MSFDLKSVKVVSTNLSTIDGIIHVIATVEGLHSIAKATQLQTYLSDQLKLTVGGIYDTEQQSATFCCFVPAKLTFDARQRVNQELGLHALKHAFIQQ